PVVERLLVVSPDRAALALGASLGAVPLPETPVEGPASGQDEANGERLSERALNAALDQAADVARDGGASALLALPADLPLITAADVAALAAALPPAPSVVLAATLDGGTSALLRQPPGALPAC